MTIPGTRGLPPYSWTAAVCAAAQEERPGRILHEAGYVGKRKHVPYAILALVEVLFKELSFSSIERAQGVHGCKLMQVIVGNAFVLFHRPPT